LKSDLKTIFESNYAPLCNYANAFLKDRHTAEDVVQTVFMQLWENGKIQNLENPTPYLLKCTRYKCLDLLKSSKRNIEILTSELPRLSFDVQKNLEEKDIIPLMNYFASQLPMGMQKIFLLSRQKGYTYKEIAEHLSISSKTVENQMGAALKKLRIMLKEHHYLSLLVFYI